jgi:malic enzyme
MVTAAAEAIPKLLSEEEKRRFAVYPNLSNIRHISATVACEVIKAAAEADMVRNSDASLHLSKGDDSLKRWVARSMYTPSYKSMVHMPVGVNE